MTYDQKANKKYRDKMRLISARVTIEQYNDIKAYCSKHELTIALLIVKSILEASKGEIKW